MRILVFPWIAFFMTLGGCSHPQSGGSVSPSRSLSAIQGNVWDSSVDIEYVLGGDKYRLLAEAQADSVKGHMSHDHELLEQGAMSKDQYPNFLKKAYHFVVSQKKEPSASPSPCRTPFRITVRIEKKTHSAQGCRSQDDGDFSRLVRDGEFLLYSKN